jgi:hypothetical protein
MFRYDCRILLGVRRLSPSSKSVVRVSRLSQSPESIVCHRRRLSQPSESAVQVTVSRLDQSSESTVSVCHPSQLFVPAILSS